MQVSIQPPIRASVDHHFKCKKQTCATARPPGSSSPRLCFGHISWRNVENAIWPVQRLKMNRFSNLTSSYNEDRFMDSVAVTDSFSVFSEQGGSDGSSSYCAKINAQPRVQRFWYERTAWGFRQNIGRETGSGETVPWLLLLSSILLSAPPPSFPILAGGQWRDVAAKWPNHASRHKQLTQRGKGLYRRILSARQQESMLEVGGMRRRQRGGVGGGIKKTD